MNTEFARQQMINQQIRAWDVLDADVLDVLSEVKREHFVPDEYAALAFADAEIPLGYGQHMLTPTIVGRILQAVAPTAASDVLEIGTGSGFLTACLATLAIRVTSLEIHKDILEQAERNLATCGIDNVDLVQMNAMRELPEEQFDVIAVTGSLDHLDTRLVDALKPGGRMLVVVGAEPVMQARLIVKDESEWHQESIFETVLSPLINGAEPPRFLF